MHLLHETNIIHYKMLSQFLSWAIIIINIENGLERLRGKNSVNLVNLNAMNRHVAAQSY